MLNGAPSNSSDAKRRQFIYGKAPTQRISNLSTARRQKIVPHAADDFRT